MNLSPKLTKALVDQFNNERYNAGVYTVLAARLDNMNLTGMAKWLKQQASDEMGHACKFYEYVIDRNGQIDVTALAAPVVSPITATNPGAVFTEALALERATSQRIYSIADVATADKDYATLAWLRWALDEQVEEEKVLSEIVEKFAIAGEEGTAILLLDYWLGEN